MDGGPARNRGHGHGRCRRQDADIHLSKALSYVLRHGAARMGLEMGQDGFLEVEAILKHPHYTQYTEQDVRRVVDTNTKQRFTLRTHPESGALQIRANQGHTLQVEDLELIPITLESGNLPAQAVHGTYLRRWPSIKAQGLRRMARRHIHLCAGLPKDGSAVSDGIPFYLSTNQVILTPGNEDGVLPPEYFQKVLQLKPSRCLLPPR
ncbi:tRNA 2'-phosphotransferase 1 isoform X2 [Narcine bancroftii]|uniref:tRNA 2'-phosphotransferase 1 isoform X2 n=1 Tax=Narcine bancroftii TaxID=1343680 RepID=UPI0038313765